MLRVIQIGLGPLGRQIVRFAAQRPAVRVVAAVDSAPHLVGLDLADIAEVPPEHRGALGAATGSAAGHVRVSPTLDEALLEAAAAAAAGAGARPDGGTAAPATGVHQPLGGRPSAVVADVAIVATTSAIGPLSEQIAELAAARLPAVSTCEELSYPWMLHPGEASRIDAVCRENGVACLGTGVNPGFLMDFLPAVVSGLCRDVRRVTVRRIQDAAKRRVPFQEKIGAGLTTAEFQERAAAGVLRHVGLPESVHMVAVACGWRLTRVEETLDPVVAQRPVESGRRRIEAGLAAGVEQWARGYADRGGSEDEVVTLQFRAAVGEPEPRDEIEIDGTPPVHVVIPGGVNGDVATCAVVLNAAPVVAAASPGLHTMLDLPVPTVGRRPSAAR